MFTLKQTTKATLKKKSPHLESSQARPKTKRIRRDENEIAPPNEVPFFCYFLPSLGPFAFCVDPRENDSFNVSGCLLRGMRCVRVEKELYN